MDQEQESQDQIRAEDGSKAVRGDVDANDQGRTTPAAIIKKNESLEAAAFAQQSNKTPRQEYGKPLTQGEQSKSAHDAEKSMTKEDTAKELNRINESILQAARDEL